MKLIQLLIMFPILISSITNNTYCQVYNFPIKPGSNDWKKLQTHDEMLQVCQIPDSLLLEMCTKSLLETCLKYPLILDFIFYNDTKLGFETMSNGFNGIIELKKRNDAGKYLGEIYRAMNTESILNDSLQSKIIHDPFRPSVIELILSENKILSNLCDSDKSLLLLDAKKGYEIKLKHKEVYGEFGKMTNIFLMTRILNSMGNKDWELFCMNNNEVKSFSEKMLISNPETLANIILEIEKIVK
ncbi:MAG: hypothetical protein JXB00_00990 [Bacteroidales bacterium]|nr:hypothetical protein [Bacteroidales bacterium]